MQLDLTALDLPFTEEEVWNTIKELPSDESPGPDGLTGVLQKRLVSDQGRCPTGSERLLLPRPVTVLLPKCRPANFDTEEAGRRDAE
jgi:hypothetical protein